MATRERLSETERRKDFVDTKESAGTPLESGSQMGVSFFEVFEGSACSLGVFASQKVNREDLGVGCCSENFQKI